jgi:ABC-type sugar transport system permease subunit
MQVDRTTQRSAQSRLELEDASSDVAQPIGSAQLQIHTLTSRAERLARMTFVLPAVLVVLVLSVFPLIISIGLSLGSLRFVRGGLEFKFVGLGNYRKLLVGSQQSHFLGSFADPTPFSWFIFGMIIVALLYFLVRYRRSGDFSVAGLFWRLVVVLGLGALDRKNSSHAS